MDGGYTLRWLDSLVTVSLNPAKSDLNAFLPEQINYLKSRIGEEKTLHQSYLNNKVFSLLEENKIRLLVNQYHSALVLLLDQTFENGKNTPNKNPGLKQLTNELTTCLHELLSFIESRYSNYLSLDERIPVTYYPIAKKEIKKSLDRLKPKLEKISDKKVAAIVLKHLISFINKTKSAKPLTFQEVHYKKELLKGLEGLDFAEEEAFQITDLNELLVYMNFNSKSYIKYFTQRISEKIHTYESFSDKMDSLFFHFKEFNQMRCKPGVILNPNFGDFKSEVNNWFTQEIAYLEKKQHLQTGQLVKNKEQMVLKAVPIQSEHQKVLCNLSVDQMALILRSANDLNIVAAKSLNTLFKSIVPNLSTPHQENISWDSMRSKSYNAEIRDKETVIQALEQMIKKIEEY